MRITYDEYVNNIPPSPKEEKKENPFALRLKDGTKVPGSTTIVGLLDKPYLVKWANKLGKQGIDVTLYVENTAKIGTLIHSLIEAVINRTPIEKPADCSDEDFEIAKQIVQKNFMPWYTTYQVEPIQTEMSVVSEEYKYGGYIDFYCKCNGQYVIVDFKTSKEITEEQILQVSSYAQLFKENNLAVEKIIILNVKKDITQDLELLELPVTDIENYWELFMCFLNVYYAKKKLKQKIV